MGRPKKSDTQFSLRIDSGLLNWLREYCPSQGDGTNVSDFIRKYLEKERRADKRKKAEAEREAQRDKEQLRLFEELQPPPK